MTRRKEMIKMKNFHASEMKVSDIISVMVCKLQSVLLGMTSIPGIQERHKGSAPSYITWVFLSSYQL